MQQAGRLALAALVLASGAGEAAAASNVLAVTEYGVAATSLPWGVAREEGLFKAAGLAIDSIVSSNGGGTAIRNMMASGMPFGEVATSAAVAAVNAGLDIEIVYSANNNSGDMAWVATPQEKIAAVDALKGKTLGYTNPRSTTEMFLRLSMHQIGMDKEIEYLATGGIAAGLTMLEHGAVAAAPVDEPAMYPAGKYRTVFFVRDYLPEVTWTLGVTTRAFAKAHPDTVRALVLARANAVDFMAQHPDAAARVYAKDWGMAPALADALVPKLLAAHYWSRGDFNLTGLHALLDGMVMAGALAKPVDLGPLIDRSFLPKDLR